MSELEKSIAERLLDPIPAALWLGVGAILSHLWRRHQGRMVVLRWQALHQPLAVSAQDNLFGTIEVLYNRIPVQNLVITSIEVENESNRDLTNLELNVFFQDGTVIYMAHGGVQGSANALLFTDAFSSELARLSTLAEGDPARPRLLQYLKSRRDFRVPVLNRGAKLTIALLVEAPLGRQPIVRLASDFPAVKLILQGPRQLWYGVDRTLAGWVGLIIGVGVVVSVDRVLSASLLVTLLAFLVGCFVATIGAYAVRTFRWVFRLLG